jgi:osmoprotectant transport system substrate-binding protein
MAPSRLAALGAAVIAGALGVTACGSAPTTSAGTGSPGSVAPAKSTSIVVGSQDFPENEVLAYVYADALKADGFTAITVRPDLGSREITARALVDGDIDMIPEYLGGYLSYVDPSAGVLSVAETASALGPLAAAKGLTVANYSQAADADAIAVTRANATKYHLSSIADLSSVASQWVFGGPAECATRITCLVGLQKYYGLEFKSFKALDGDGPLTVAALQDGSVQAVRILSDATISSDHLVVLSDPRDFQGAGNIVPIVRNAQATPQVLNVLNRVSAALTTRDLVDFNVATWTHHDDPQTVAQQFVSDHKL